MARMTDSLRRLMASYTLLGRTTGLTIMGLEAAILSSPASAYHRNDPE